MKLETSQLIRGLLIGLVIVAAACARTPSHEFNGNPVTPPGPPPDLTGINWDGQPFQLEDLAGRAVIVFFGYTYCPDVCPMTLAKMKQLYSKLGDRSGDLAVVFVSVDATRDTIEKMANYVPNFDPRFYGLRLDPTELATIKESLDLTIQFGQPKDGPGTDSYYYVDHTGTYFLLDRQHQVRVELPPNATVEEIFPDVAYLLAE